MNTYPVSFDCNNFGCGSLSVDAVGNFTVALSDGSFSFGGKLEPGQHQTEGRVTVTRFNDEAPGFIEVVFDGCDPHHKHSILVPRDGDKARSRGLINLQQHEMAA